MAHDEFENAASQLSTLPRPYQQSAGNKMEKIDISVIIPVFNDEVGIEDTLSSLRQQTYKSFEILVVDNGSTDGSFAAASKHASCADYIKVFEEKSAPSSYAARNRGIACAQGDILVFLDANMTVAPDFLQQVKEVILRERAEYLGYRIEVYSKGDRENLYEQYDRLTAFPVEGIMRYRHFSPTAAVTVRKHVFEEIGPFDQNLVSGGDNEFGNRVYNAGFKHHYADEIRVYHPARSTLWSLVKKAIRLGRGEIQLKGHPTKRKGTAIGLRRDVSTWSPSLRFQNFTSKIPAWDALPLTRKVAFIALRTLLFVIVEIGALLERLSLVKNFR